MPEDSMPFHLENGRLAAYIDHRLPADERAEVEAHLADCAACRAEVVAVGRLRRSLTRRSPWVVAAPVAAAAVLVFVLLGRPSPPATGTDPVVRGGSESVPEVVVVTPSETTTLDPRSASFVWHPVASGVSYRFVVTDSSGGSVWNAITGDTIARLPAGVHLAPGGRYYWYVDALLADGRSVTSGAREFRTMP